MTERGKALWILAFLSPIIAEMLSGSSPPFEFFFPLSLALLVGLYGAGALLIRELAVIWSRGWVSIIVMGAAYGILEEGVAVKSFFDPNWMDLGGLGVYGRYLGTNWVWAVWLTIFHSAVSITLAIFILHLIYPHLKDVRFLTRKRFELVFAILFLDVLACTTLLNPYVPLMPMYILAIFAVFALTFYARHIPKGFMMPPNPLPTWSPRRFAVLGFVFLFFSFFFSGLFVKTTVPFLVPIVLLLMISGATLLFIKEKMGASGNLPQKAHFVAGILCFFIFLGLVVALGGVVDMYISVVLTTLFVLDLTRWSKGKKVLVFRVGRFIYGDAKPRPTAAAAAAK